MAIDLYRYGIRLTYDLTIPEPGSDLLSKMREADNIRKELEGDFDSLFILKPEKISFENADDKASEYGIPLVESHPEKEVLVTVVDTLVDNNINHTVDIVIPDKYQVQDLAYFDCACEPTSGQKGQYEVDDVSIVPREVTLSGGGDWGPNESYIWDRWKGRSGTLKLIVKQLKLKRWYLGIKIPCVLCDTAYKAWQQKIWGIIRDGCKAKFEERHVMLKERLRQLEESLDDNALSFRKREREEVMKGVLRWMGIEGFTFYPSELSSETDLYGQTGLVVNGDFMRIVQTQSEKIKFLHQAIEWENMLYFLYPYFWCNPGKNYDYWEFKKYLNHPDPLHRVFLKAGSARVVLTIRPSFEDAFMTFVNTGEIDPEAPYIEIGKEFQNYAQTNYPGIPPANPVKNYRPLLYPKQEQAWDEMQKLMQLLDKYNETNHRSPSTEQGLAALQSDLPTKDPWGHDYVYTCPGVHGDYDLASLGADGKEGGEDENADITSWAEASLIGRWYEYTPTSALDIDFDAKLPKEANEEENESSGTSFGSKLIKALLKWLLHRSN